MFVHLDITQECEPLLPISCLFRYIVFGKCFCDFNAIWCFLLAFACFLAQFFSFVRITKFSH